MTTTRTPSTLRLPANRHPVPTRTRLRTRRVPIAAYAVILLALPVAVLLGARATGWWITTGHTVSATTLGADTIGTRPTGQGGQNGGGEPGQSAAPGATINPHDVKGSMTVQQVLDAFPKITATELLGKFGAPASTPTSTQLKTLAQDGNGYEVDDLREWLETQ
jgi:hypothetical protein